MHSSTTAILLLLALFGTGRVACTTAPRTRCENGVQQVLSFTLEKDIRTWSGHDDKFGLTKANFKWDPRGDGKEVTFLFECCCDSYPYGRRNTPEYLCQVKCGKTSKQRDWATVATVLGSVEYRDISPTSGSSLVGSRTTRKLLGVEIKRSSFKPVHLNKGDQFELRTGGGIKSYHREFGDGHHGARIDSLSTVKLGGQKRRGLLQGGNGSS